MVETLKGVPFEYVVCECKFSGDSIFIFLKNFEKIRITLAFLFLQLMERECFLILNEQTSPYKRTGKRRLSKYLENLVKVVLKSCLPPMSRPFFKFCFNSNCIRVFVSLFLCRHREKCSEQVTDKGWFWVNVFELDLK